MPCVLFAFESTPILNCHIDTIGNGMGTLDRHPGIKLAYTHFVLFEWVPTDTGGVENYLGAAHSYQARSFRIPLIPAYLHAYASIFSLESWEAKVTWSKEKLFVVKRII